MTNQDDDAVVEERMEHMIFAIRHLIYAATNSRGEAIGVISALLAEFCGKDVPRTERHKHLDRALLIVHETWKLVDHKQPVN